MNIILFLFMVMIGMLVAGSTNMLYTVTNTLNKFIDTADVADIIVFSYIDKQDNKALESWAQNSPMIADVNYEDNLYITNDALQLPEGLERYTDTAALLLSKQTLKYNKIYTQDNKLLELQPGEIGVPSFIAERSGLKIGDSILITVGNKQANLSVKYITKDVAFGSGILGIKRLIIHESDYDFLAENAVTIRMWSFRSSEDSLVKITRDLNNLSLTTITSVLTVDTVQNSYIIDIMIAAIMIVVSIFLMLIAFLILRFTITFTLQEDYKQIGIMKAIGLKNKAIGNLYLIKYLFLAVTGSLIGFFLSLPFSKKMLEGISRNLIMTHSAFTVLLSIVSVVAIVLITLLFCKSCTRKLNHVTAIDAIRSGATGERFSSSKKIKLHTQKSMPVPLFLAISDLVNGWKRFIILAITFIAGTFLVLVPINVINTLDSEDALQLFGYPKTDVFINNSFVSEHIVKQNADPVIEQLNQIEELYRTNGEEIKLYLQISYNGKVYVNDPIENISVTGLKGLGIPADLYTSIKGTTPQYENEVAITEKVANALGVNIGDTIQYVIGDKTYSCIITGLIQGMFDQGNVLRMPDTMHQLYDGLDNIQILGDFISTNDIDKAVEHLKEITPDYEVMSSKTFVLNMMGSIDQQLDLMKNLIIFFVISISFLITVLLVHMLISREIPEIAILKSAGVKDKTIKSWQTIRISIVLMISVLLGTVLSNNWGHLLTDKIFSFMGATRVEFRIVPFEVYFIYPVLILVITMLAILSSLGQVRKTKVWEINNQE